MDLSTIPAIPPPAGETSNFNPDMTEIQRRFITVYTGTLVAATLLLGLRVWTRIRIVKAFWIDDYAVIGAWLMDIGFFVCCIRWMAFGFGDHLWSVSLEQLSQNIRINPDLWFRGSVFFLMVVIFGYTIATTLIVAAGCKPTDPTKTQCINNLALAQAILDISSDFFIVILPLPMVWKLRVPTGQKIGIAFLLSGGSFVVISSIIRLAYIQNLPGQEGTTWVEAVVCVLSAIGINVGLVCNCLMALKPFARHYGGSYFKSFNSKEQPEHGPEIEGNHRISKKPWNRGLYQLNSATKVDCNDGATVGSRSQEHVIEVAGSEIGVQV